MTKFAVIRTGGKQYLIKEGDVLKVEKLEVEAGQTVTFDDVLLTADSDGSQVEIGNPKTKVKVIANLVKQGRAKKILVVHYKPKIRYHKRYGHRQSFSEVKVEKIG